MSILIVEDNPINAMVLENFLAKGGYQTAVAKNAQDALACLPQMKDLQLIITDLSMPEMDGLELIAHLRRTPAMKDLPVIIVTGHASASTVGRAKELECAAFLVKPVDKIQLLNRVESLLNEHSPVLQNQQRMLHIMGIGTPEYEKLIKAFRAQLRITLSTMAAEQAESDEPISENAEPTPQGAGGERNDSWSRPIFHALREIERHHRDHAAALSGGTQGSSGSRRRAHGEITAFAQTRHAHVTPQSVLPEWTRINMRRTEGARYFMLKSRYFKNHKKSYLRGTRNREGRALAYAS